MLGSCKIQRRKGNAEARQFVVGDRAHRVLVLRAGLLHIDQLRPHGLKLRPRLRHIHLGRHAARQTPLGQIQLALESLTVDSSSLLCESSPRSWK